MRPRLPSFIYIVCYSELQGGICRCSSCRKPCMAAVTAGRQAESVYMLYTHGYIIGFPCSVGRTTDSAAFTLNKENTAMSFLHSASCNVMMPCRTMWWIPQSSLVHVTIKCTYMSLPGTWKHAHGPFWYMETCSRPFLVQGHGPSWYRETCSRPFLVQGNMLTALPDTGKHAHGPF